MNKDDIIMKILDNELSPAEQQEAELLMQSDMDFASEVEGLSSVENQLHSLKTIITFQDLDFINNFGQSISGSASNIGSSAAAHKAGGIMSKILTKVNLVSMSIISSVIVITGGTAIYLSQKMSDERIASNNAKTEVIKNVDVDEPIVSDIPVEQNTDIQTNNLLKPEDVQTKNIVTDNFNSIKTPDELTISIKQKNKLTNAQMIENLGKELSSYEQKNDLLNMALTQKRLGVLINQTGNFNKASSYFEQAIENARILNNYSLEAESLGEFGLALIKSGNSIEGMNMLEKCISILKSKKSERADYWQNMLDQNN